MQVYQPQPFQQHLDGLRWAQGEHVLIAAPTGAGKSTMMQSIIQLRGHVVVFVSKLKDETFNPVRMKRNGWKIAKHWDDVDPKEHRKVLLWPTKGEGMLDIIAHQRVVFADALNKINKAGGWCIVIDEAHYTSDPQFLGLGKHIALLHHQGRSSGISVVTLTQRPSWIPKIIYSSVSHAYIARTRDADDLKRLSQLGGVDSKEVADNVYRLPTRFDYVYVPTQTSRPPRVLNSRR